jgi:1-acyl-sn-glycerol-3-phosphate acyltransferase
MSLPRLPPGVPRFPQSTARRLCARWFESSGWRTAGVLPDTAKLVVIAAPHSSWWDGFWGLLLKYALGIDVSFMAKRQLFRGPLGSLLRGLGGIPIERDAAHGVVEQMIGRFADRDALWLAIAPEGTRKPVRKWKMGFWHIARGARVPILPVYFDYPSKTIGFGPLLVPGADASADLAQLRAFYAPWRGKRHGIG